MSKLFNINASKSKKVPFTIALARSRERAGVRATGSLSDYFIPIYPSTAFFINLLLYDPRKVDLFYKIPDCF
jgi:hypothetical protein